MVLTRRKFLGETAAAAAGIMIVPRHVLGRGFTPPSDRLNIGVVACGGRGRDNLRGVSDEYIVALCDVDVRHAEQAQREHPDATIYTDFYEMLDREHRNLDAVVITTPDHTHAVIASAAMKRGKHVYCDKPLTRTIGEARALMATAREAGVATQMGNQGHAAEGVRALRELVEAGVIGTVREIHFWTNRPIWPQGLDRPLEAYNVPPWLDWDLWLGPAPFRPYAPAYAPFRWRGWWDFGTGALGDIAVHSMDAAFWILDLGLPTRVEPETSPPFDETAPALSRLTFEFPARGNRPALRAVWRDGGLSAPRPPGLPPSEAWPYTNVGSQLWVGDDGSFLADAYGGNVIILDEDRRRHFDEHPPEPRYPRTEGVYAEWIAAAKGGPPAGSNFPDYAGPLTQMVLTGNLAVRMQTTIELDPSTGRVTNVQVPEEYIMPEYRAGWSL